MIAPDADRALALYNEGLALYRADDFEGALAKYDESLLYGESFAPSGFGRGQALYNLGRLEGRPERAGGRRRHVACLGRSQRRPAAVRVPGVLNTVTQTIAAREANAAAAQQQQAAASAAQEITEKVTLRHRDAVGQRDHVRPGRRRLRPLGAGPPGRATTPTRVALYYAKALTAMERGADAVPYAETALRASEGPGRPLGQLRRLGPGPPRRRQRRRGPLRLRDDPGGRGLARGGSPTT